MHGARHAARNALDPDFPARSIDWFERDVPAMDEVEFRQNCRLSRSAGHFLAKARRSVFSFSL